MARYPFEVDVEELEADLDAFVEDFGVLPDSLAEIGVPIDGKWTYTVIDAARFELAIRRHGQIVAFDSIGRQAAATGAGSR